MMIEIEKTIRCEYFLLFVIIVIIFRPESLSIELTLLN